MKNGELIGTIDALSSAVAAALAEGYAGAPNARVREVPDRRTIRYYTTLGLIDRPAEMHGRTAIYSWRHLLQVVAIKKLQARGQSLAEIQQALTGLTDTALARMAEINAQDASFAGQPVPRPSTRAFWKQEPKIPEVAEAEGAGPSAEQPREDRPGGPIRSQTFHGVPLLDGVTLLLASSRPIEGADLEAIRTAAGPLIETLIRRQLIHPHEEGEPR
jgi:DNA-binding transcriptional MerR regulator